MYSANIKKVFSRRRDEANTSDFFLSHEQIHILQRQYQEKFNEFYKQLFNNPRHNNTRGYGYHLLPIKKELVDYTALEIEHIQIQKNLLYLDCEIYENSTLEYNRENEIYDKNDDPLWNL